MADQLWPEVKQVISDALLNMPNLTSGKSELKHIIDMCEQKFEKGSEEHGEGTWVHQEMLPQMQGELIDVMNYAAMWQRQGKLPALAAYMIIHQAARIWDLVKDYK